MVGHAKPVDRHPPMLRDAKWLEACKQPARVIAGLFLFSIGMLALDRFNVVSLAEIGKLAKPTIITLALLTGGLSIALLRKKRREARLAERDKALQERRDTALARIDYLSADELHLIAECLRKDERTFLAAVHSPPVGNLQAKELMVTPGGEHHRDLLPLLCPRFCVAGHAGAQIRAFEKGRQEYER